MYPCSLIIISVLVFSFSNAGARVVSRDITLSTPGSGDSIIAPNSTTLSNATISSPTAGSGTTFWLEQIKHQGVSAFNANSSYKVFRNVKDFGAKGDGVSDDTAAINLAISSGSRCAPGTCQESTKTPALVYIPGGTYLVSAPIIDFYFTQIIGNPNDMPTLRATKNFTGFAVIDGNPYQPGGTLAYNATNVFYRQIRNLILDTTDVAPNSSIKAIHWPTAQATSLEKLIIRLSDQAGTQHQGLFIESGSGGFMSDIEFYGGLTSALMGSQQFTSRNLWFYNAVEAIEVVFDWGWTYKSIYITNCTVGLNMTNASPAVQNVGSIVLIDSSIVDTPIGIATSHDSKHWSVSNGSVILENVGFHNVQTAVQGTQNFTALPGTSGDLHVNAWGIGHQYAEQGPQDFLGTLIAVNRVASLTSDSQNGTYNERSKPNYDDAAVASFVSVQSQGARGDGVTDDTAALQAVLDEVGAGDDSVILFFDAGTYKITKTLKFPRICRVVGESYATIMSSGPFFNDMSNPRPVVQVGQAGDSGSVEWSDMIVSTQGAQAGAILIEWNVATTGQASGMWDVHTRIGGFAGSNLGLAECPATPGSAQGTASTGGTNSTNLSALAARATSSNSAVNGIAGFQPASSAVSSNAAQNGTAASQSTLNVSESATNTSGSGFADVNQACIGAFMSMHVTKGASGLYMENVWLWTADHDLDATFTNITVYSGRGLLVESEKGDIWMQVSGTAAEHHSLYQYQLSHTQNIYMGMMQAETAYYQPSPAIGTPFPPVASLNDPNASDLCKNGNGTCDGYGLRVLESQHIAIYGAGLYSFYNAYNESCSMATNGEKCQQSIFSIEGSSTSDITVYTLNTVGASSMVDRDGVSLAKYSDNIDVFPDSIAKFYTG